MQMVEVLWDDACTDTTGWTQKEAHIARLQLLPCRSVGYLLAKTSKYISVVQSYGDGNGQCSESITIPRSCIRKIRKLR